jgi:hypothetical protein
MFTAILIAINILVLGLGLSGKKEKKPGDNSGDDHSGPDYPCA